MVLIKKITVDESGEVRESYICDGQEILPETYYMLEGELEEDEYIEDMDFEEDCDGNCCDCEFGGYKDDDELYFGQIMTDAINDTLEMFDNPTICDDCKARALIDLVMIGADGALEGYIIRE
ncbi:MAG: hypothetical protein PHT02_00120 [Tissierellia bacterium]|nr:hypothetical protein [Tissierellia bacterium]